MPFFKKYSKTYDQLVDHMQATIDQLGLSGVEVMDYATSEPRWAFDSRNPNKLTSRLPRHRIEDDHPIAITFPMESDPRDLARLFGKEDSLELDRFLCAVGINAKTDWSNEVLTDAQGNRTGMMKITFYSSRALFYNFDQAFRQAEQEYLRQPVTEPTPMEKADGFLANLVKSAQSFLGNFFQSSEQERRQTTIAPSF